jgi:hypothetical protein
MAESHGSRVRGVGRLGRHVLAGSRCDLDRGVRSTWGAWVNTGHVGQTTVHGTSNARATHYAWGWLASPSDGPIGLSSKVMNSMCAYACVYIYI